MNLDKVEINLKQDSENRSKILEEVERNMDAHTKKIVEYDYKAKVLEQLQIKYDMLKTEAEKILQDYYDQNQKLTGENQQLSSELMETKRTVVSQKSKINNLKSVIELMINDFGIEQVALATGLEKDKLKEYLQY